MLKPREAPESRKHSPVKLSGTTLPDPAHSLKDSTAHKENPAHGGPDSRDRSTAKSLGVLIVVLHIEAHIELHTKIILLVEP